MRFLKPFIRVYLDFYLLGLLIDYTRRVLHIEWLRYSPIFCLYINKGVALVNKYKSPPFFATCGTKKKRGFGLPKKKGMCPPVVSLNKLFKRNFGLVPSHPIPEGYPPQRGGLEGKGGLEGSYRGTSPREQVRGTSLPGGRKKLKSPDNCFIKKEVLLDPMWVTGFVDAEGCFSVIIEIPVRGKDSLRKVRCSFEINLHEKDAEILYKIQSFFGVGAIYNRSDKKISVYRVTNVNYLNDVIIPHFTNYPLLSKKGLDFILWSKVIKIILNKDHLSKSGFLQILSYYGSINRGISKKVSKYYTDILPYPKPNLNLPDNLNPHWVSGFVAGDGGFSIYVRPAKDYLLLEKVYCRFHIAQHSKDIALMRLFIKFFGCGVVNLRSNLSTPRCDFIVQDITS